MRACIVETSAVPDPKGAWKREVAKFCAGIIRDGLRLEHSTVEAVRAMNWVCPNTGKDAWASCPPRSSKKAKPATQESLL
jgi:hypothetical protein